MVSPLKDPPLQLPGQSLDEKIHKIIDTDVLLYASIIGFSLGLLAYTWIQHFLDLNLDLWLTTFILLLFVLFSYYRLRKLLSILRNHILGRDGERVVGQLLEELRADGAVVFHDINTSKGNIDHIIVSPKGVFTVETKTWSKRESTDRITLRNNNVIINGYRIDNNLINQSKAEASWLLDFLKSRTGRTFDVRPIILFPGWYVESTATRLFMKQEGILLLSANAVIGYLSAFGTVLNKEEVQLIGGLIANYVKEPKN